VGVTLGVHHEDDAIYLTYLTAVLSGWQGRGIGRCLRAAQLKALSDAWHCPPSLVSLSSARIDPRSGKSAVHAQSKMLAACGMVRMDASMVGVARTVQPQAGRLPAGGIDGGAPAGWRR
jgi:hypothetical protein